MSLSRKYETTFIVNAALEDQDIDSVVSKVTKYIEDNGGNVNEVNKWGRKRLAYPINKKFNGFYVHCVYNFDPYFQPGLEKFLILEDPILRHLSLQLEDELIEYRKNRELEKGKEIKKSHEDDKKEVSEEEAN